MNPPLQDAVRNRFHRETLEWNHPGSGGIAVWSHDRLLWAHSLHLDFQHLWIMSCCFTNLPIKCFASLCWTLIKASMSTEEETEENWPQHDRRALKLRSSDTHRLWWNGRWHAAGKTLFYYVGTVGFSHFNIYGMAIIYNDRTNASAYNLLVIPDCHRHTLIIWRGLLGFL